MSEELSHDPESSTSMPWPSRPTSKQSRVEGSVEEDAPDAPSGAELFTVLKNRRRRYVLRFLLEEDRRVSLAELAVHMAAEENDVQPGAVTSAQRKRVYVSLYQSHLPLLDDVGAVEYSDARKYAYPREHIELFRPYVEPTTSSDPPWSRWYLSIGVLGAVSSTVLATEVVSMPSLKSEVVLAFVTVFLLVALLHSHSQRQ